MICIPDHVGFKIERCGAEELRKVGGKSSKKYTLEHEA